jgi:ABC-type transport system substrate-binding protein
MISSDMVYAPFAEAVSNNFRTVGIRVQLRPLERAAFFKEYGEKKLKHIVQSGSAAFGNAATRIEAYVAAGGLYVYGSYPDIDGLFAEQATELDRAKREATLLKIQQLMHDKGHNRRGAGAGPAATAGLFLGNRQDRRRGRGRAALRELTRARLPSDP